MIKNDTDEKFMKSALKEAMKAYKEGEVPVGCVIVREGKIIAKAGNSMVKSNSSLSHAEMKAIRSAQRKTGDWRLEGCTIYSTVEPCIMCISAIALSRIERAVYGCKDPKFGGCGSLAEIHKIGRLNHKTRVEGGVLAEECAELMREFFREIRKNRLK